MTKDPAIAIPFVSWSKEAEMRASWVANKPAPDCRTCEFANIMYDGEQCNKCTNGDQYQPAPPVVLWRTE